MSIFCNFFASDQFGMDMALYMWNVSYSSGQDIGRTGHNSDFYLQKKIDTISVKNNSEDSLK